MNVRTPEKTWPKLIKSNSFVFLEKVIAEEERAKASEEKFQKLKNMYTQIRDEHIKLLRQASSKLICRQVYEIKWNEFF